MADVRKSVIDRTWRLILQLTVLVLSSHSAFAASDSAFGVEVGENPKHVAGLFSETGQLIQEAMNQHGIPAVAVVVVDRDGILWMESFGHYGRSANRRVTEESIFSVQSISKTFSAAAVMIAADHGLVDLDTPISRYLPSFKVNSRFENSPEDKITLRHLLSHTAGFTHEAPIGNNVDASSPSFSEHVRSISETWLKFPVGTQYSYSNLGIDLAAHVVAERANIPFAEYVDKRLFKPLGMESSFVDTPRRNGNCDRCATGHHRSFSNLPEYVPMVASGGVRVTIEDAARFVRFFLNDGVVGGHHVMSSDQLDEMLGPHVEIQHPFFESRNAFYGLGVYLFEEAGTYAINHDGGGFGFRNSMKWYPEYGIGYFMLMNSRDGEQHVWEPVWHLLERMVRRGCIAKDAESLDLNARDVFFENRTDTQRVRERPARMTESNRKYLGNYTPRYGGGFQLAPEAEAPWGRVELSAIDGVLHLRVDNSQPEPLVEHEPGLFIGERSGEVVDLRDAPATWKNLPLKKRTY